MAKLSGLCVIPARGGSKRLPRKNVADFLGRPIISHSVEAAIASGMFQRVMVSTEDAEIAAVSRAAGAQVFARDPRLADDHADTDAVCIEVLEAERALGRHYEVMCCLYATAPLRSAEDIRNTVALIVPGECDYALAVTDFSHYAHQALKYDPGSGGLEPMWPDLINVAKDDIGPLVAGNGSTYVVSVAAFEQTRSFFGPKMRGYWMPRARSVDIDVAEDLELARYFGQRLSTTGES